MASKHTVEAGRSPEVNDARVVKRSVSVRRDLDTAVLKMTTGTRQYSAFVNEALALALQSQGIGESIRDFERRSGPLTAEEKAEARRRRTKAASSKNAVRS
jgi:hypothetical protein